MHDAPPGAAGFDTDTDSDDEDDTDVDVAVNAAGQENGGDMPMREPFDGLDVDADVEVSEEVVEWWAYVASAGSGRHPVVLLAVLTLELTGEHPITGHRLQQAVEGLTETRARPNNIYYSRDWLIDGGYVEVVEAAGSSDHIQTTDKGKRVACGATLSLAAAIGCEEAVEALADYEIGDESGQGGEDSDEQNAQSDD